MPTRPPGRPAAHPAVPRLRPFTPAQKARVRAALDAITGPLTHLGTAAAHATHAMAALATSHHGSPTGRPAWTSPYGPPAHPTRR